MHNVFNENPGDYSTLYLDISGDGSDKLIHWNDVSAVTACDMLCTLDPCRRHDDPTGSSQVMITDDERPLPWTERMPAGP